MRTVRYMMTTLMQIYTSDAVGKSSEDRTAFGDVTGNKAATSLLFRSGQRLGFSHRRIYYALSHHHLFTQEQHKSYGKLKAIRSTKLHTN